MFDDIAKFRNNSRNGIVNDIKNISTTLDWFKSLRADIRSDCLKVVELRSKEVGAR